MTTPREIIANISELPTLPSVVARVNELVNSNNASAGDINDVISRDIALSSRVLKLVNSSFYGFPRRITSITHSVVILGFNTVRNLVLSAFVFNAFNPKGKNFDNRAFWTHSVGTAVAASALAQSLNLPQNQREDAFIGGLLHDVGKVVLGEFVTDKMDAVLQRVESEDCLFLDAEKGIMEFGHYELGGCLLEEWNLPVHIVELVRHHHNPAEAGDNERMCSIIHLGDIIARSLCIGNGGDNKIPVISPQAWEAVGIEWEQVDTVMDQTQVELSKASAFLDLI